MKTAPLEKYSPDRRKGRTRGRYVPPSSEAEGIAAVGSTLVITARGLSAAPNVYNRIAAARFEIELQKLIRALLPKGRGRPSKELGVVV